MPTRATIRQLQKHKSWRGKRQGRPGYATNQPAVTFPGTPLVSKAMIALTPDYTLPYWQWGWADISDYVRWEQGVVINAGRREQADLVDPGTAQLTLDNRDGRFSRQNPLGPYYGYLKRSTPIWLSVNPGSGFVDRFFGHIVDMPKRWDRSATDSTLAITCRGTLHRMLRQQPLQSTLRRAILGASPDYYWHFEDSSDASQFASGLTGGAALTFVGSPLPGSVNALAGSKPFADFDGASGYTGNDGFGNVSITLSSGYLKYAFVVSATAVSGKNPGWQPIRIDFTGGTLLYVNSLMYARWNGSAFDSQQISYNNSLAGGIGTTTIDPFDGAGHDVVCITYQSSGNVVSELWVDGELIGTSSAAGTMGTPYLITGISGLLINWGAFGNTDNAGATLALGHLAIWDSASTLTSADLHNAAIAGLGEQAHERVSRLCSEDGITLSSQASRSATLGEQPDGNLLNGLRDAEKAAQAVLYEATFGLGFKSQDEYYNQVPSLTLDIAQGHLTEDLEPSDSDLRFHNRWTANRTSGSSATRDIETGITDSDLVYAAEDTFNVQTDDQLPDLAGWQVHRDSFDEDYWPNVAFNLAKHPSLIPYWTSLPAGARIAVNNIMPQAGIDSLDLIVEGYQERWDSLQWDASLNTSPASIYTVGAYDDGISTYAAKEAVLAEDLDTTETGADITATGETWATTVSHADAFPFDVSIGGLTYACTAITGSTPSYTLTLTRLGTDKTHGSGSPVAVTDAAIYAR